MIKPTKNDFITCDVCGMEGLDATADYDHKKYPKMHIWWLSQWEIWLCPEHNRIAGRNFKKLRKSYKKERTIESKLFRFAIIEATKEGDGK